MKNDEGSLGRQLDIETSLAQVVYQENLQYFMSAGATEISKSGHIMYIPILTLLTSTPGLDGSLENLLACSSVSLFRPIFETVYVE